MKLALCLSGGGVKGAAHIGVLRALEEAKIKYDYISGTSSGSIVAALNAMGYNSKEIYEFFKNYCKILKKGTLKNITKGVLGLIFKQKLGIQGLNNCEEIEKIIDKAAKEKNITNINQIKMPLLIPSVDLNSGAVYMFSSMDKRNSYSDDVIYINDINIGKAVRASCSYPGYFIPCKYKDIELIDGGIRENTPWKEPKNNGADKVLCVTFENEGELKKEKHILDILTGSIDILRHELENYEIDGADYILKIRTKNVSLMDCSKIKELYELGYKEGKKFIKIFQKVFDTKNVL